MQKPACGTSVPQRQLQKPARNSALLTKLQTTRARSVVAAENGGSAQCGRLAASQTALSPFQVPSKPSSNCALRSGQKYRNPTSRSYFAVASNSSSVQTPATPHSTRKPRRLTIRSTGQFAACRLWASFHSRTNPAYRKLPVSSNVRRHSNTKWRPSSSVIQCAIRKYRARRRQIQTNSIIAATNAAKPENSSGKLTKVQKKWLYSKVAEFRSSRRRLQ